MALTLMSWNLADLDLTAEPDERQRSQLERIAEAAPDILCCQELGSARHPSQVEAGFERFKQALGMSGRLGLTDRNRFHVAVLWRGHLTEIGPWLPLGDVLHRNVATTTLGIGRSGRLRIGTVHLPSSSVQERLEDLERVRAYGEPSVPTVLAGDWNNVGEDASYDADAPDQPFDRRVTRRLAAWGLTDAAHHLGAPWAPTWGYDGDWPEVRIDAFRVSAAVLPALVDYHTDLDADHLSDHRPIRLVLEPARLDPV